MDAVGVAGAAVAVVALHMHADNVVVAAVVADKILAVNKAPVALLGDLYFLRKARKVHAVD